MIPTGVLARGSSAVSILFVDDDADTRFVYQTLATEEGMSAEIASDGTQAIALANALLPDVIVLDVGLSSRDGLDGFEVARRLRASAHTSAIPIIFLSGSGSARDNAAVLASGCEGHLVKPSSADALFGLVAALATKRREQTVASSPGARTLTA